MKSAKLTRRIARRVLVGLAVLITLVVAFYTEENWRGKHVWEQCKRELEAKGAVLDWNAYIPARVPDSQNIFKAPKMEEWFVGRGANELSDRLSPSSFEKFIKQNDTNANSVAIARLITIAPTESVPSDHDAVWELGNTTAREDAAALLNRVLGASAIGSQGFTFVAKAPKSIKPLRVIVRSEETPTATQLQILFPEGLRGQLKIESEPQTHSFRVKLDRPFLATDYLAWSASFDSDFDLMREALKRPYARIDIDAQKPPYEMSIPNFVFMRTVVQTLAQRAQCHMLLDQPAEALRDLSLIHSLCRLLKAAPTGKPMTLVSAMIDVAITGLYVDTFADGLRLHVWQKPQLAMIQRQLSEIDLIPELRMSFECGRASICRTLEIVASPESGSRPTLWQNLKHPLSRCIAPSGWTFQNMTTIATLYQKMIDGLNATNDLVSPDAISSANGETERLYRRHDPYAWVAAIAMPNCVKATQTLARNQTLVNEAFVVCALERYHYEHDNYPETLDALVPEFAKESRTTSSAASH